MATKIVRTCDICDEPADSIEVSIPGVIDTTDADLCERHWKELVDPLVTFLIEHGAKVRAASAKPKRKTNWTPPPGYVKAADKPTPCLWCSTVSQTQSRALTHLREAHGFAGTGLNEAYGAVCPVCGESSKSPGAHVARAHAPMRSIWEPFHDKALRKSDPHGVIAAAIERGKAGFPEAKPTRKTTRKTPQKETLL